MTALTNLRTRLDEAPDWIVFLVAFLPVLALFLATASYRLPQSVDTVAAAIPAWRLAVDGSVDVEPFAELACRDLPPEGCIPWFIERSGRLVSNRPPGAVLSAVPFYWLVHPPLDGRVPSLAPAAVAAATATAAAVGVMALVLRRLSRPSVAIAGAVLGALGTSTWSVSANALWQHGADQLWLGLALLGAASGAYAASGAGFALAVFTRAITAVPAAVVGLYVSWRRRSLRPALLIGLVTLVGLGALVLYNRAVFDTLNPVGGYDAGRIERNLTGMGVGRYLENVAGFLADPIRGLLVWSPFLVVLLIGVPRAWRAAPPWVRGAALGALAYALVQLRINDFTGGDTFFAYRLPLEALTLSAPLLFVSWSETVSPNPARSRVFRVALAVSIGIHLVGATVSSLGF